MRNLNIIVALTAGLSLFACDPAGIDGGIIVEEKAQEVANSAAAETFKQNYCNHFNDISKNFFYCGLMQSGQQVIKGNSAQLWAYVQAEIGDIVLEVAEKRYPLDESGNPIPGSKKQWIVKHTETILEGNFGQYFAVDDWDGIDSRRRVRIKKAKDDRYMFSVFGYNGTP